MALINNIYSEIPISTLSEFELYQYENLAVFRPSITINKEASFSCYHFILTGSNCNAPPFIVDDKIYEIGENMIFPVNPGQVICSKEGKAVKNYVAMFVESHLISDISNNIYGSSNLLFCNNQYRANKEIFDMISFFIYECKNKQCGYTIMLDTLSIQISLNLIRHTKNNLETFTLRSNYSKLDNILRVEEFIYEHYNDDFTITDLSKIANLSPYHFIRVFKAETGKTPYEYILDLKVKKAMEMLQSGKYSMTEVSSLCGFANPSHFSTIFKKKMGISPSDFNKLLP